MASDLKAGTMDTARAEAGVGSQLNRLQDAINETLDQLKSMATRLEPILMDPSPQPGEVGDDRPLMSELAHNLASKADQLETIVDQLRQLRLRVDL